MKRYLYSDLIMENSRIKKDFEERKPPKGYCEDKYGDVRVCRVEIPDSTASDRYVCSKGHYVTVYTPMLHLIEGCNIQKTAEILSKEIHNMIMRLVKKDGDRRRCVLVAGVGNREIASDSLGPKTAEKVSVTRHVELLDRTAFQKSGLCSVSAVICGVMGNTGIQSAELIRGAVREISPDAVIVVDALVAKDTERLAATVQISDAGISPGAGIGQRRVTIDEQTLGVPVIALGVPTVISAATLISDAVGKIWGGKLSERAKKFLDMQTNFFVAPKECDIISERVSEILANAIDMALGVI